MIVVVDTNVFVRETHLLRKKGGQDLVQHLRAINGRLFVPEILEQEYLEQTVEAVKEHRNKALGALDALKTLAGLAHRQLPEDDAVEEIARNRLQELQPIILKAALDQKLLAAAGNRSIGKRRPSSKTDHGYKDCLIWEFILQLPPGSEVRLVSRDNKAFLDKDRLWDELLKEAKGKQINVLAYGSIEDVLAELLSENQSLDLSASETTDSRDENEAGVLLTDANLNVRLPNTAPSDQEENVPVSAEAIDEVEFLKSRVAQAQEPFDDLDLRILGFVAYLGAPRKEQVLELLSDTEVPLDQGRNAIDRLIIVGLLRDTGNHYVVPDRLIGDTAAAKVEHEIIALLLKDLGNG